MKVAQSSKNCIFFSILKGSVLVSSVTLVEDGGYNIIVDSPSATDLASKEKMLKGFASLF